MVPRSIMLLLMLLTASLTLNVALGVAYLQPAAPVERPRPLASRASGVGATLPGLGVADLDGKQVSLTLSGRPTILYVFSRSCGWCTRNLNNVRQLIATQKGAYRIVALSVGNDGPDDVKRYLEAERLVGIEAYVNRDYELLKTLGMGATPQTIVTNETGRIVKSWFGAFSGQTGEEVQRFFSVAMPGL